MNQLIDAFYDSRRWAKIVGIISMMIFAFSFINITQQPTIARAIGHILGSVFSNFLPGLFLLRYAKAVGEAETSRNPSEDLEIACINQGRYFKTVGIIALLILIVVGIAFALGLSSALM